MMLGWSSEPTSLCHPPWDTAIVQAFAIPQDKWRAEMQLGAGWHLMEGLGNKYFWFHEGSC